MTLWKSDRVDLGTPEHAKAKTLAEVRLRCLRQTHSPAVRLVWQDEYNDTSARGRYAVVF